MCWVVLFIYLRYGDWIGDCGRRIAMHSDSIHSSDSTVSHDVFNLLTFPLLQFEEFDNPVLHYIGAIKRHPDSLTMPQQLCTQACHQEDKWRYNTLLHTSPFWLKTALVTRDYHKKWGWQKRVRSQVQDVCKTVQVNIKTKHVFFQNFRNSWGLCRAESRYLPRCFLGQIFRWK